jgi:uncharacterized protein YjiS (DUF1127 family)
MTKMTVVTLRHRAPVCAGAVMPPVRAGATVKAPDDRMSALIRLIGTWIARAQQRRALADLDAHLLHDLGIDPLDAAQEVAKPFWRA